MKRTIYIPCFLALVFLLSFSGELQAQDDELWEVDIPYVKYTLPNGLTLIVHEDHKAPIVAVNIWYHVGSKNEKPGKTGFAHLFEHLMFNGSEHFNDDYFQALERMGATDLNGTTNRDRTNYFQNVPVSALDAVLWLESDRMGYLLGAIDQAKLDEQRGVVQNEKRQGENQPYGRAFSIIAENTYPKGHPYSWTTIGSMEDLNAATLEDVKEWFRTYYGAANAVLVVAGDVHPEEVKAKVEKYFGFVPPGPPLERQQVWIAKREEPHRVVMQDRVPQARIYKVWNVPEWGNREAVQLSLVADVLAGGSKTARLYRRLVYEEQVATSVRAFVYTGEIGSQFMIIADVRPGQELHEVESLIDEELARFLQEGPTAEELQRVKMGYIASFVRGIERIGGFGGKSDVLAMNEVYGGSPDYYKTTLRYVQEATTADLQDVARRWLDEGVFVLEVHPFEQYKTLPDGADRTHLPEPGTPPKPDFPEVQRTTLSNGLEVVLAERHTIPQVLFSLQVNAGYASDFFGIPGQARLAASMLDEGTTHRTALQISEELAQLGTRLSTGSDLDMTYVFMNTLKPNLKASLDIFADVILHPTFPEADFQRLKKQQIAAIQREQVTPTSMALRVLPRLLYGPQHPYGQPLTGSGTIESVSKIQREHLETFHRTWFKPNNATLIVVGDITMEELLPQLEAYFASWKPGEVLEKQLEVRAEPKGGELYLLDRPGSLQSLILAGELIPPKNNPDELAIEIMNAVLGGEFTSRINMNLREDKHWSYGAFTFVYDTQSERPFIVYAPVQTDKTRESIEELQKELTGVISERPITEEEFEKVRTNRILQLPGTWETMGAVENSLEEIVRFQLPDDYYDRYPDMLRSLSLERVQAVARKLIHPGHFVWVVVGDRAKIEEGLRMLGFKALHLIDADGNVIEEGGRR